MDKTSMDEDEDTRRRRERSSAPQRAYL